MKANEFILESPMGNLADWMQAQIVSTDQAAKSKVQQQNLPKIVDLLQQSLEARVYRLFSQHKKEPVTDLKGEVTKIIIATVSKITKTDITKNKETFGDSIGTLIDTIISDLDNLKTSTDVTKSLTDVVSRAFAVKHTSTEDMKELAAKISKMHDDGATKEEIAAMLAKEPEIDRHKANDIADKYTRAADDTDEPEDGPGTTNRLTQFDAEVFYPQGKFNRLGDGEQLAYVNREGKWSLFQLVKKNEWAFVRAAGTKEEEAAIEHLIKQNGLQPMPVEFKHLRQDYYQVS